MTTLVVAPMLVWLALAAYLFAVDRKLTALEVARQESDL